MGDLCLPYKVLSTKKPACVHDLIPPMRKSFRHPNTFNTFYFRTEYFKKSFFPSVVSNGISSILIFVILAIGVYFAKPYRNLSVEIKPYHINDSVWIKLIARLILSFSLLHENKFRHNFKDMSNPLCSYRLNCNSNTLLSALSLLQLKPSNPHK